MSLEQTILDLTSKTPSGGTCWIGNIPFTVWYCSDYWEWVFRGVYYFDPQDLSEAIEAFVQQGAEASQQVVAGAEVPRTRTGAAPRKSRSMLSRGRPVVLAARAHRRPDGHPAGR